MCEYTATVTGEVSEVARLGSVIETLPCPDAFPDGCYPYQEWGDQIEVECPVLSNGTVTFAGEVRGDRNEAWGGISRQFPDLTFRMAFTTSRWHRDVVVYRGGLAHTVERRCGYFVTCDPSAAPVHHWTVWGDLAPGLLSPYLIPGSQYEHPSGEYPVRDADGVRAALTTRGGADAPGPDRWGMTAWTLDEDAYVQAVQTIRDPESRDRPELKPHVLALFAAAQRETVLTQDEVGLLTRDAFFGQTPEFVQLERDLPFLAYHTHITLHPTPNMIRHLLGRVASEERRVQLGAAMKSPRWAGINGRWPQWELLAMHWAETRGRPPEPLSAVDMEAFTAELRALEAGDPVQG
jgi:hypothetical protein